MSSLLRTLGILPACLAAWVRVSAASFELKDGDRVLFMGDTFFEREVNYGHIEARLTAAYPDRGIVFRNLSWSADTPMGKARASFDWNKPEELWLKRVKEQVGLVKPTVAFLSYGMTAALEGGTAGVPKYTADLSRLMTSIEEVSGQGVRFVLCSPIRRNDSAGMWAPATRAAGSMSESVDNAIQRSNEAIQAVRKATEALARERSAFFLDVYELCAELQQGAPSYDTAVMLNEPGYSFLASKIYAALGAGAIPSEAGTAPWPALTSAIRHKNELFFHRWRPANWTYLFGFRKHEQGRNAVEIPQFDPLVEAWDGKIARLRNLKAQDASVLAEVRSLEKPTEHRDPNYKEQPVPTFEVADGFEVTLWAENPMLYKPIQMNWDAQGRLWVASSRVYPQIRPGQEAEDAIIVIEDTNGDGKADKSTVFADRILIPTGVVPDNENGCYAACSHELIHFKDTDGDGKADVRRVAMTSFGTEDTHHNLHTLRWGYDGHLYLNQSIYTHTHVETPLGVARLNSAGIWRYDPLTWKMEIFTKGGCNPWGHHWDQWGNHFFTDGAGGKGVYHAMDGATYFTYSDMRREAASISPGNYPKFASIELVHSPLFPADWQGNVITCDFRAHRVVRFGLTESGSTFQTRELPDVLRSTHVTFRPIDLRFGPDGALYIADWSNPIIQHGEVDFRDPRRDHEHGRIWRLAPKASRLAGNQAPVRREDLTKVDTLGLLDRTLSRNGWTQEQSRRVLVTRGPGVLDDARTWLRSQKDPRAGLEVVWLHEAFNRPIDGLLADLAASSDPRLRTAAARQLAR